MKKKMAIRVMAPTGRDRRTEVVVSKSELRGREKKRRRTGHVDQEAESPSPVGSLSKRSTAIRNRDIRIQ